MKPAIEVSKLSKKYTKGEKAHYLTLRDTIAKIPGYLTRQTATKRTNEFWALQDVSFTLHPGEVTGLIGRNGAGKSTLLKILSRITEPSSGTAILRGRLGSLLEVGTGFHFELTGRENIYLYGAILGMKRSEITNKFTEIVDFAEVGDFLDTPLKHYSSGMYLRLAFAVAAHLETEILLVDEVLAVGDIAFQQKSVKKMDEVAKAGKTVLFVSHNMSTIAATCERSIVLEKGRVVADGKTESVIKQYLSTTQSNDLKQDGPLSIQQLTIKNSNKKSVFSIAFGQPLEIEIKYNAKESVESPYFIVSIMRQNQSLLTANMLLDSAQPKLLKGKGVVTCRFHSLTLLPGLYEIGIRVIGKNRLETFFLSQSYLSFTVTSAVTTETQLHTMAGIRHSGPVFSPYSWTYKDSSKQAKHFEISTSPV